MGATLPAALRPARRPRGLTKKGTFSRAAPDYYSDLAAGYGLSVTGSSGNFSYVLLWNSATAGEILHVWGVDVAGGTSAQTNGAFIAFGPSQAPLHAGIPTNGGLAGAVPGQVSGAASGIAPYSPGQFYLFVTGPQTWQWTGNYPFCILPPNWSLVIANIAANQNLIASFWWIATPPLVST